VPSKDEVSEKGEKLNKFLNGEQYVRQDQVE